MSIKPATASAFDQAIAEIPSCALDEGGLAAQRARYVRLAPTVSRIEREAEAVLVEFREEFDRQTLEETLAVERQCCPFFLFEFDASQRQLRVTVREPEQLPALDAMAQALRQTAPHHASAAVAVSAAGPGWRNRDRGDRV